MKLPKSVLVTGQEIDLTKLTKVQRSYFLLLAKHIKQVYLESGKSRYIISISGPSGSGKSVFSAILEKILEDEKDFICQTIDLDSFHYTNNELREKRLIDVKGRYDTYDIKLLKNLLELFKDNTSVVFPYYSRIDHETHSDGPVFLPGNAILLLPGLWIQRKDTDWSEIRKCIDYTITLEGSLEKFKENTITRHMRGGRTRSDAEVFYDRSDLKNSKEILQKSVASTLSLPYFENILTEEDLKFLQQ